MSTLDRRDESRGILLLLGELSFLVCNEQLYTIEVEGEDDVLYENCRVVNWGEGGWVKSWVERRNKARKQMSNGCYGVGAAATAAAFFFSLSFQGLDGMISMACIDGIDAE